ncbi:Tripartite DNA replication factor [Entophlyctis sp. JEL0112]|nr:Tripartite DNA replication factor [Entophlyctis sp. JEL0112]
MRHCASPDARVTCSSPRRPRHDSPLDASVAAGVLVAVPTEAPPPPSPAPSKSPAVVWKSSPPVHKLRTALASVDSSRLSRLADSDTLAQARFLSSRLASANAEAFPSVLPLAKSSDEHISTLWNSSKPKTNTATCIASVATPLPKKIADRRKRLQPGSDDSPNSSRFSLTNSALEVYHPGLERKRHKRQPNAEQIPELSDRSIPKASLAYLSKSLSGLIPPDSVLDDTTNYTARQASFDHQNTNQSISSSFFPDNHVMRTPSTKIQIFDPMTSKTPSYSRKRSISSSISDDFDLFESVDSDENYLTAVNAIEMEYAASQMVSVNSDVTPTKGCTCTSKLRTKTRMAQKGGEDFDEFSEFYDDCGFEELAASIDLDQITKKSSTSGQEIRNHKKLFRFIVLQVHYEERIENGITVNEKILRLFDEIAQTEIRAELSEDWYNLDVSVGVYVHIVLDQPMELLPKSPLRVTNTQNFLVIHPDHLVSATQVADSFSCLRKAAIQDICRIPAQQTNVSMVYGNILHEVMQSCLLRSDFSVESIASAVKHVLSQSRCLEELWAVGETESTAYSGVMDQTTNLQKWWGKYGCVQGKQPTATIPVFRADAREPTKLCVSKVLDIEEHIWSPMWGIKGNIDASLEVKIQTGKNSVSTHIMPFELKTGKNSAVLSHRAQASLYTLMMQDRYDVTVHGSLLFYLRSQEMSKIPFIRDEIRGLILNRNKLASALASNALPPLLQNSLRTCTACYALPTCLVFHKTVENGDSSSSGLGALFEQWERLLAKEEQDIQSFRKELWTMTAGDREKSGSCFSDMVIIADETDEHDSSKISRFMYTMKRSSSAILPAESTEKSFLNLRFGVGDPIVVSSQQGHYALAIGFLVRLDVEKISISVDRRLRGVPTPLSNFNAATNQAFCGLKSDKYGNISVEGPAVSGEMIYRVDKDEFSAGMALVRGNLVNLFVPNGDEKCRRLIVDLEAPTFRQLSSAERKRIDEDLTLNVDQKSAIARVLAADDYSLILGMPGTGKTTTISQMIKILVSRGNSVLLTAYTHSAVDNVLLKLKAEGVPFVRLGGGSQRIHPDLQEFSTTRFGSVNDVRQWYEGKPVVATTCLGIKHPIFAKRKFDYCIVDEASQLTLPVCIGPLRFANVFVLVGDHYQLPPLVKNTEARDEGLSHSLFRLLSEKHPASVTTLYHQYRMCADIMLVSNTMIYESRLKCGSKTVANAMLPIDKEAGSFAVHASCKSHECARDGGKIASDCWLDQAIDPSRRVLFFDTDCIPGRESGGLLMQNHVEAHLLGQTVKALRICGIPSDDIGVISPYKAQLKIIHQELKDLDEDGIESLTIDKYQGRDKACVIISLVRSNAVGHVRIRIFLIGT